MKKSSIIAAALMILDGCTDTVPIPSGMEGTALLMNAIISSADSVHHIILHGSKNPEGIVKAPDAEISFFVNGALADATSSHQQEKYGIGEDYQLKARFTAGDTVRVEALFEGGCATAEVIVPEAPVTGPVKQLEMISVPVNDYGNVEERDLWGLNIPLSDPAGEGNSYRLAKIDVQCEAECIADDDEGTEYAQYSDLGKIEHSSLDICFYTFMDPVFKSPGHDFRYSDAEYSVFNDRLFDGTTKNLYILTDKKCEIGPPYGKVRDGEVWVYRNKVRVLMESITPEAFRYLNAVQYDGAYDLISITHVPTHYPSNVTGGLGYLVVCSASLTETALEPKTYYGRTDY